MPFELPEGLLTAEKFDNFTTLTKGALAHLMETGEVPAFLGEPMSSHQAMTYLEEWLARNQVTLAEGGVDFLAGLVRKIAIGEEEQPIEEFDAALAALTDEQLVAMNELEADAVEALKKDVIDRRRALVADILATGKELLRGAIATGLHALMAEIGAPSLRPGPTAGGDAGAG